MPLFGHVTFDDLNVFWNLLLVSLVFSYFSLLIIEYPHLLATIDNNCLQVLVLCFCSFCLEWLQLGL
jgi:hypothetical protein